MSLNIVILQGNLCADPELRKTSNDTPVAIFRIATNEYRGGEEHAEFHRVVCWDKTATNVKEYCQKGKNVTVVGRLQHRSYDDNEGVTRYVTEVNANRVNFGASSNGGNGSTSAKTEEEALVDFPDI